MNTEQQHIRAKAKKIAKEIVTDSTSYVESVAKEDIDTLGYEHEHNGAIRMIFGASTELPYRALSYVESLARVALHFDASQVQIIHACNVGSNVNGVNLEQSVLASKALARHTESLTRRFPALEGRVIHAIDTPQKTEAYQGLANEMMARNPALATRLRQKASRHDGDPNLYLAAHYAYQSTDELELDVIHGADQACNGAIISVGCQQERLFHAARMAMHDILSPPVLTAQIFTKHQTPPYYMARGGEPALDGDVGAIADRSARKDIEHYERVIKGQL